MQVRLWYRHAAQRLRAVIGEFSLLLGGRSILVAEFCACNQKYNMAVTTIGLVYICLLFRRHIDCFSYFLRAVSAQWDWQQRDRIGANWILLLVSCKMLGAGFQEPNYRQSPNGWNTSRSLKLGFIFLKLIRQFTRCGARLWINKMKRGLLRQIRRLSFSFHEIYLLTQSQFRQPQKNLQ